MEYETIPQRFYALHDGATGKSVIQEVGSTAFQIDVDTVDWLKAHRPVSGPEPRVRAAKAKPEKVTPTGDIGFGLKADGTPRLRRAKSAPSQSASNGHQTAPADQASAASNGHQEPTEPELAAV